MKSFNMAGRRRGIRSVLALGAASVAAVVSLGVAMPAMAEEIPLPSGEEDLFGTGGGGGGGGGGYESGCDEVLTITSNANSWYGLVGMYVVIPAHLYQNAGGVPYEVLKGELDAAVREALPMIRSDKDRPFIRIGMKVNPKTGQREDAFMRVTYPIGTRTSATLLRNSYNNNLANGRIFKTNPTRLDNGVVGRNQVLGGKTNYCFKFDSIGHIRTVSPVAFDLNKDATIGVTGQTTARDGVRTALGRTVDFDMNADGAKDTIEWMSGDGDALLVDNRDGNAAADMNGHRLFGDENGTYSNGYEKLATLDANHDGAVAGTELTGLQLWVDNGDAAVQPGELQSLTTHNVTSVSVGANHTNGLIRSTATLADGSTLMTEDVWFGAASIS